MLVRTGTVFVATAVRSCIFGEQCEVYAPISQHASVYYIANVYFYLLTSLMHYQLDSLSLLPRA